MEEVKLKLQLKCSIHYNMSDPVLFTSRVAELGQVGMFNFQMNYF
jgi:hypothetical protein